jgi:hypothetical protein
MRPLRSSNIAAAGYDDESRTLFVEFLSGSLYAYDGVPREVYDDLCGAPSPGRYFASRVTGVYTYRREA